mgnify:CR=1 FL=1
MAERLRKNKNILALITAVDRKSVYYISMAMIFGIVFLLLGERGYLLWKDSEAYLAFDGRVGIMPLYPLYLHANKILFGEGICLYTAVAGQTILAGICILAFTEFIRRRFCLSYLASYPVYLFSMFMPFTVNFPESISNHDILTEALAYPLFYLYMICFLKSIFDKKYRDIVLLVIVSVILALTRTQMQLIGAMNAAAFFYVAWMRGRTLHLGKQIGRGILCAFASVIIVAAGEALILGANSAGQNIISAINKSEMQEKTPPVESTVSVEEASAEETSASSESISMAETVTQKAGQEEAEQRETAVEVEEEQAEPDTAAVSNITDQYGHLLIDKAIYEIDEDDFLLFEDEELQKLCQAIYEAADREKNRYVYARKGLWMWEDIMNGIAGGTHMAEMGWTAYLAENPDTNLTYSAVNQIAAALAFEHLGRIVYHTIRMMPQGFICTVFFQKSSIYLLCHIIVLLIYVSALALVIWGYRKKEVPRQYPEFLLGCIVVNILFVFITTIMFFAMQRYLIYCFGIFYVSYYLSAIKFACFYLERIESKKL